MGDECVLALQGARVLMLKILSPAGGYPVIYVLANDRRSWLLKVVGNYALEVQKSYERSAANNMLLFCLCRYSLHYKCLVL